MDRAGPFVTVAFPISDSDCGRRGEGGCSGGGSHVCAEAMSSFSAGGWKDIGYAPRAVGSSWESPPGALGNMLPSAPGGIRGLLSSKLAVGWLRNVRPHLGASRSANLTDAIDQTELRIDLVEGVDEDGILHAYQQTWIEPLCRLDRSVIKQ